MKYESLPSPARKLEAQQVFQDLESYATFDRWIDAELEKLVARWIHRAAPNAQRAAFREKLGR
jgi:hypothetical protein